MQCSGHLRCPCRQNQMLINLIAYLLFVSFFFLPCSSAALEAGRRSQRVCRIAGDPLSQKSPLLQLHCQLLLVKLLNREQSLRHYFYIHAAFKSLFEICREFLPNANFITANFVTAVFQNFPDIFS